MRAAQATGGVEGVSEADMAAMRAAMEEHDEVSTDHNSNMLVHELQLVEDGLHKLYFCLLVIASSMSCSNFSAASHSEQQNRAAILRCTSRQQQLVLQHTLYAAMCTFVLWPVISLLVLFAYDTATTTAAAT
jgi:hypothetical protein